MSAENENSKFSPKVRVIPAKLKTGRNDENPGGKKKRIAAYARVSTLLEHQASSYELQVSYYTEFIQKNPNWEFIKVYTDEGITGTSTKNRTGFLEMIEDAKSNKFDYIITKSISRFARNTLDCLFFVRMLKGLDPQVGIFFEKENLDSLDNSSELFLTILSSMAQEESKSLSMNATWGVMKRFSQGKAHIPTKFFLGYDRDEDGNIIIKEEEAEIVRRIYREFLEGKGAMQIAKGLMKDKIRTGRGNPTWTSDSVLKILKNEKHKGDAICQKTVTLDFLTHKRAPNNNHKPKYLIKNNHPAIISEELWNQTQEELKRRSDLLRDPDNKYKMAYSGKSVFSNKLYCGECGRPVTRRRLTSKRRGEYFYFTAWQCRVSSQRSHEDITCSSKYIWEEILEKAFMRLLHEMNRDRDRLIKEAQNIIAEVSLSEVEFNKLGATDQKLNQIADQISELAVRESITNDPIYDASLRNLIYEQEIILAEHEYLNNRKNESEFLRLQLEELLGLLDSLTDEDGFRDDIFMRSVEQGMFNPDYQVEFKFKCGVKRSVCANRVDYLEETTSEMAK